MKQNLVAWLISFVNKQGIDIKSALSLLNLLDMILSIQRLLSAYLKIYPSLA